jgi:hypothetical protein
MKRASHTRADNRGPTPTEKPGWNSPDEVTVWIWTDGAVGGPFTYAEVAQLERERGPIPGMLGKLPGGDWMPWPDLEAEIARGPRDAAPPAPPEDWVQWAQRRFPGLPLGSFAVLLGGVVVLILLALLVGGASQETLAPVTAMGILLVCGAVYFLPAIIAGVRNHHQRSAITVLNLVAGWTLVGWVVALVWAFVAPPPKGG